MRFRQIHLDFHTNGRIPGIGTRFDAKAFGKAFKDAYVDSVTVFSKCHHGYSYHPTEVGEMHPGLEFDLLRGQIDALHAEGINAPVYLTATWDELAAFRHPEWRAVSPEGGSPRMGTGPNGAGWAFLDFSTPYLDYLVAQTEEVMQRYPDGDGIFMDIAFQLPSVSASAQQKMEALGLDWTNPGNVQTFHTRSVENFFERIDDAVHKHNPKMPLFFNSGHIRRGMWDHYARHYTHIEAESLPTAGWGYDHFPLSARYVDPKGMPLLGMTGKFHYHWGEVGGYKKPDALVYEVGAMMAQGARCSIGDHLHPTGSIDKSTMAIITPAYKWVAEREAWVAGSVNRAEIALMSAEAVAKIGLVGIPGQSDHRFDGPDHGAIRVLLEGQFAFDVVDPDTDLTPYRLLILPDAIAVDAAMKVKIDVFVAGGGRVLLTGRSGIDETKGFLFDVGADWKGTSDMTGGDYLLPTADLRADGVNDPLFMYLPSERISVTSGQSLGAVHEPYMDRTPRHFSGHVNAPSKHEASAYAAGSSKGGFTYLAHPIFSCYFRAGAVAMLEIAEKAIRLALGRPALVTTGLPRAGRVTVRRQEAEKRDIVHLLYATPALRGNLDNKPIQPIQDLITLSDIAVEVAVDRSIQSVRTVPDRQPITFAQADGRVTFTVPSLRGHQMIEINYR